MCNSCYYQWRRHGRPPEEIQEPHGLDHRRVAYDDFLFLKEHCPQLTQAEIAEKISVTLRTVCRYVKIWKEQDDST